MRLARSILGGCFFLAYGVGSLLIGGLLFPLLALFGATRAKRRLVRASWVLFVWVGRITGLFRVAVSDADRARLAACRGRVVVANHITLIDIIILTTLLPDTTGIAKAAAGRNFFYALIVKGMFLINDDPARVLSAAADLLQAGVNLVVFPEGTRVPHDAAEHPLRRGAAQIALRAGAPVLPVALVCDPPVLAKGQPWYELATRTIVWRVKVLDEIPVAAFPAGDSPRAAARLLTARLGQALFGARARV